MKTIVPVFSLIATLLAVWSSIAFSGPGLKASSAASSSTSIDVMKMMREAGNLPDEQFDAI